jgi:hypothetical protein
MVAVSATDVCVAERNRLFEGKVLGVKSLDELGVPSVRLD